MIYSKEELQEIADVCKEKDIWIVSDEIYEKLIYGGRSMFRLHSFRKMQKTVRLLLMVFQNRTQ